MEQTRHFYPRTGKDGLNSPDNFAIHRKSLVLNNSAYNNSRYATFLLLMSLLADVLKTAIDLPTFNF